MLELPWYVYALLGAFFVALASVLEKKILLHDDPLHYSGSVATVVGVLSLPLLFFVEWSSLSPLSFGFMYIISLLAMGGFYLTSHAMKGLHAGELSIILSLTPAVTALFAFLFLAESLTERAFVGVIVIVLGLIVLELPSLWKTRHAQGFTRKIKYLIAAGLGIGIYAVSSVFDRIVLGHHGVPVFDFLAIVQSVSLFNYLVFSFVREKQDHVLTASFFKQPIKITVISLCIFASRVMHANAISLAYVALASALKRTSTLFTIVLAKSYLHERGVGHKLLAAFIIILGVLLVIL